MIHPKQRRVDSHSIVPTGSLTVNMVAKITKQEITHLCDLLQCIITYQVLNQSTELV